MENKLERHPMNMESEIMTNLRAQIDSLLKKTLLRMQGTHCNTAKMAVAMEIELVPSAIPDGKGGFREGIVPKLRHKVKTQIQITDEEKGAIPDGYELVWDGDWGEYFVSPVPRNQTSMFDDEHTASGLLEDDDLDIELDEDAPLPFEDDATA